MVKGVSILASLFAIAVHADNINGVEFVDVFGGPGDSDLDGDRNGYGNVGYDYKISQFEISYDQFVQSGIITGSGNIDRWVSDVGSGYAPVVNITYHEAAQYANWLSSTNASVGVYTINGSGEVTGINRGYRNSEGIAFALPTEDEWYRAAYNISGTTNYSLYANGSDVTPPLQGIEANYGLSSAGPAWGVTNGAVEGNNETYNMMGNVWEWLETPSDGISISNGVAFRGGSFRNPTSRLEATYRNTTTLPDDVFDSGGMRIVAIPEPGTISLMGLSTVGLFATRRIRRRKYFGQSVAPIRKAPLCDQLVAEQEELQQVYGADSETTLASMVLEMLKEKAFNIADNIRSAYEQVNKTFWNHMVVSHERRMVRRKATRQARKEKIIAGFDAFLARIMK